MLEFESMTMRHTYQDRCDPATPESGTWLSFFVSKIQKDDCSKINHFARIGLQRLERLNSRVSGHDDRLDQVVGGLCPVAASSKTSAIYAVSYLLNIRQDLDDLQPHLDRQSDSCSFLSIPD